MLNPHRDHAVPSRLAMAIAALCFAVLLLPAAVLRGAVGAQSLEGVVYDPTGAVLPDVAMTLAAGDNTMEAVTDAAGRFVFAAVEPGTYVLEARLAGFRPLRQNLELADAAEWDRAITLQVGDVQETINVRTSRTNGAAPPRAAASGPTPVRVGGNIRPPMKLKDHRPVYPDSMREAGREGVVPIEAVIGVDGKVASVRVVSAQVHPDFAIAAIDAVRRWEFAPTLLNGAPVEVVMNVSVSFTLE
jgi:TonB family protein